MPQGPLSILWIWITIGAFIVTYTILVVPFFNHGRTDPKSLFELLRPPHYMALGY